MSPTELQKLQYPIGNYQWLAVPSEAQIAQFLQTIAEFPSKLEALLARSTEETREWPYRPGGWNTRQLVHHCADSHTNALIRFKWALSEEQPTIKAYSQTGWAALNDYQEKDLNLSLMYIKALHERWLTLLKTLSPEDLARKYHHPEREGLLSLGGTVGNYAWHCEHHLAHIQNALNSKGAYA